MDTLACSTLTPPTRTHTHTRTFTQSATGGGVGGGSGSKKKKRARRKKNPRVGPDGKRLLSEQEQWEAYKAEMAAKEAEDEAALGAVVPEKWEPVLDTKEIEGRPVKQEAGDWAKYAPPRVVVFGFCWDWPVCGGCGGGGGGGPFCVCLFVCCASL